MKKMMNVCVVLLASTFLALGCGGDGGSANGKRAGKTASGIVSAMGKGTGTAFFNKQRSLSRMQTMAYLKGVEMNQTLLDGSSKLSSQNGVFTGACTSEDADFTGCTCSTSNNDSKLTFTCTNLTESYACGGTTYSVTNGSVTVYLDFGNATFASDSATGTFAVGVTINGTVSDGTTSGVMACTFKATGDFSDKEESMDADCNDSNFSCTFAGEAVSCSDIEGLEADCGSDSTALKH